MLTGQKKKKNWSIEIGGGLCNYLDKAVTSAESADDLVLLLADGFNCRKNGLTSNNCQTL